MLYRGEHALFLPSILQEEIRREHLQSVLFAFPDEIEITKHRGFEMFFHDSAANTVNMVDFSVPTCCDG